MAIFGRIPKSAELRLLEGNRAHRPLPPAAPKYAPGVPERPKGMTAAARRIWDGYVEQLGPMGVLRPVDGFALRRLCEDVAMLQELQAGTRRLAGAARKRAKVDGRAIPGGGLVELTMSPEGRRLSTSINSLAQRIKRDELQFGLTPVSSQRIENITAVPVRTELGGWDPVEAALCGHPDDFEKGE